MKIENAIKQARFRDSYEKAFINLIYTSNWLRDKQTAFFRPHDLIPQHYNILRILRGRHPHPISPGEIRDVMLDKTSDVTRLIDKLVKKGLVKRSLCETNRRKMDIQITEKGLRFLDEIDPEFKKISALVRKKMTEKQAEQLSQLMDLLRDDD